MTSNFFRERARLGIALSLVLVECAPELPWGRCAEFCDLAFRCGILPSWLGEVRSTCETSCRLSLAEGGQFQPIHDWVDACYDAPDDPAEVWCSDDDTRVKCAAFVSCLELAPRFVDGTHVEPPVDPVPFLTRVNVVLATGPLFDGHALTSRADLDETACVAPLCFEDYWLDDEICAEIPPVSAIPVRMTLPQLCLEFGVREVYVGIARTLCNDEDCRLVVDHEVDRTADDLCDHPLAPSWRLVSTWFDDVRVGPIYPFLRIVGETGPEQASTDPDGRRCWALVGQRTRATLAADEDEHTHDWFSTAAVLLPTLDELDPARQLAIPCDVLQ